MRCNCVSVNLFIAVDQLIRPRIRLWLNDCQMYSIGFVHVLRKPWISNQKMITQWRNHLQRREYKNVHDWKVDSAVRKVSHSTYRSNLISNVILISHANPVLKSSSLALLFNCKWFFTLKSNEYPSSVDSKVNNFESAKCTRSNVSKAPYFDPGQSCNNSSYPRQVAIRLQYETAELCKFKIYSPYII